MLTFNSLRFNFNDPLTGLLGIRWYIEHKSIDIIKWGIFKETKPGDLIVAIGGRTGRDGIHGATFSSAELTHESEKVSGGAVRSAGSV